MPHKVIFKLSIANEAKIKYIPNNLKFFGVADGFGEVVLLIDEIMYETRKRVLNSRNESNCEGEAIKEVIKRQ